MENINGVVVERKILEDMISKEQIENCEQQESINGETWYKFYTSEFPQRGFPKFCNSFLTNLKDKMLFNNFVFEGMTWEQRIKAVFG